jgi:hypothetical protein
MSTANDEAVSAARSDSEKLYAKRAYKEKLAKLIPVWRKAGKIIEWNPPNDNCLTIKEFCRVIDKGIGTARLIALGLACGTLHRELKWMFRPDRQPPWITIMACKTRTKLIEFRAMVDAMTIEGQEEARKVICDRKPRGHQKKDRKRYNIFLDDDTCQTLKKWAKLSHSTRGEVVKLLIAGAPWSGKTYEEIRSEIEQLKTGLSSKSCTIINPAIKYLNSITGHRQPSDG